MKCDHPAHKVSEKALSAAMRYEQTDIDGTWHPTLFGGQGVGLRTARRLGRALGVEPCVMGKRWFLVLPEEARAWDAHLRECSA